jgi:Putative Flp pilus-assembly TadE/G-like
MTGSFGDSDTRTPSIGSSESGQALVWFVAALMVLLGFAALTIDVGSAFHDSGKLQNAADAASLAGAGVLPQGSAAAITQATNFAQKNGYVDGQNGYHVSITTPYNGDPAKIAVTISGHTPAVFATVLGINFLSVSRRAVATYYGTPQLNAALLALDPSACSSYYLAGGAVVTITTGGLMANSSCPQAQGGSLTDSNNATTTATVIQYYTGSGYSGPGFSPTPVAVSNRMPDPLASMVPPVFCEIGCPVEKSLDSGGTAASPKVASGIATFRPGVYYGGIKIDSSSGSTVTFLPGTYVLAGGGLSFTSIATTNGDGVMIYNTSDPQQPTTQAGACGGISLTGGGSTNFTPPTSGPYKDVVFWQDPACTAPFTVKGGGTAASGVYYLPSATFNEDGNKTLGSAQIIADQFSFGGKANFSITSGNYISLPLLSLPKLIE